MKKRVLSILLAAVLLLSAVPLGLAEPVYAAESGAQILTPTSGTSGTGANGGTWKCSSAGDTLTLTNYDGYPIETDATTIRFSGTNTITVPLANLSGALRVYGLKLTSTKDIWIRGEDGSSLNIVFKPGNGTEDVGVSGIDAKGPLYINTAGDITISAPYGSPYGIRARQGLDLSGTGALDITVKGSYFWKSKHWCAAYGIVAEKGAISLSGSGSKTIRVQSSATSLQIDSTPYAIYHKGGTGSSGTATISVDTGALHIEMNGDGCGIYNMGSADSAYVNINNVPELSIEKADSAIATAYAAKVNVRNSKLRITNGRYAIQTPSGTVTMENAEVTAAVRGSNIRSSDAAVYAGTLQVKGGSTVDMTATYGTVVYAGAVSVNLSSGSFTAKTGQSNWPPISAPVTLGAKTRLVTGVCSDADAGTYAGELVDASDNIYETRFASVISGSCGENLTWTLTPDGVLTISGTGAMTDYYNSGATPWHSVCSQIKSVIIEDGVTRIGNYAFSYCDALAGVTIPDSVTTIGDQAFKDCKALTSMAIPSSVTMIGDWAFDGCGALTDIYYGGYGIDWLSASGNYCGIPSGTTVHFKSGYGKGSCGDNVSWVLPLDGTLTISGTGAMEDYDIDNAPWYSFRSQVKSVIFGEGVTRIGISAFKNCDVLTSVTIPNGVSSIGEYAFSDCSSLTSVTIPGSVTKIGHGVFDGCKALTDIYYDGYGLDWAAIDGNDCVPSGTTIHFKNGLYGRGECGESLTWTLGLDGELTISGTGAMADYEWNGTPWASARSEIKSVVIGDGVTRIGDYAFQHCRALTGVTIPGSVTAIGDSAFYYCTSLASVTIPGGVTAIGDRAFAYCKTLTGVTIPDGVTGIDSYAFAWCSALTSAAIPGSVSDIGEYAFYECGALTDVYYGGYGMGWLAACDGSIVVPGGTTVHFKDDLYGSGSCGISARWVMDSDGALTISGTGRISNYDPCHETSLAPAPWYAVRDYVQSVVIEDGITGIGNYAFYGCEELTSVTIPDGVTDIGDAAFGDCTSLTGVVIPAGVTAIRNKTFYGCVSLTSITLPQGMTSIGGSAFSDCISLTSVAIPDSVTRVETGAFDGCTSLTDVTLPKSLTRLGGEVFRDCTSLTGMTVPEGVDCIYGSTFANCTSLTSVTLPSTVNWIGENAFFNCVRLSSVTIPKRVCYIYQDAFRSCDSLADVYYGSTTADWAKIVMEDGNGDLTHATLHCTAPAAPAAPVVTAGNSAVSGKPMLTWNAVEGATSYKVYRAAKEDGTYGLLGSTSATSYTNTGAKAGTTYWYKVKAVNAAGESAYSNIVSGKVKSVTPKPAAPVVKIGNSAASGKPMLTWNAVSGATSYKVYRATSQNGTYSLLGTVTATSYTNTGAKAGTTYWYKVKAVNSAGESAYSNIVSGQAKAVTPKPSAPVVKIGNSAASGKPMLTWNAVSGATSYKVYRATSQNGTYSLLGTVTATSYTNTGAKAGTTYWYKVKAVNSAGESAYSNIVSGKATVTALTLGHSSTSGKPMLTWKAVSGAASYKVYRATAKNGAYSVINTTKALTYTNTGAALGTTYYYKVEALNASGKSMGFSAVVEGKVAPVLAVGYSSVSGKPQLTWKSIPGATEYQVYRSTQQNSGYSKINTTTSTSYVNTGAKANTMYYYRIVAVKGTAVSDFSNIVSARPGK